MHNFLNECLNSILRVFYMFQTSCVHHQEVHLYMQFFYGIFLCVYVSSLAGGRMCLISRYCDLLKIKIFYVYIKLFRTIILTSAPSITNTFKTILTSTCLCKVRFCFLVNILRKQDEAEWALDSTHEPSVVPNQLWVQGLGRYACDIDWHPRYSFSLI
jgi:hypothetical protein